MPSKKLKNPKGGLTAAGRAFYKRTEGANLKPGVKSYSKASPADKKRWVRWALRFAGRSDIPPLKKPNGEATRFALMFAAWGEPVPTSVSAVRKVYKKALSRRDQLGMGKAAKTQVAMSDTGALIEEEVFNMESEVTETPEVEKAWEFASDKSLAAIHFSGDEYTEEDGFIVKEILRTGEWGVIPTKGGLVNKPLRVVKDGLSDAKEGIISLAEIVSNFKLGAVPNVQIPLSDDSDDHKNITRLNTGYIRDVWVAEDEDGNAKLVAKMDFTEPEVKERVLRGTYSDVSCGIPWSIVSRGKKYGASLEHVAITNRPFIDGLGPFLAASDDSGEEVEVTHFSMDKVELAPGDTGMPIKEGDIVSFTSDSDVPARHVGRVEHVMEDGVYGLPDSEYSVEATPENPALAIRLYKLEEGKWTETALTVGARASDVIIVDPAVQLDDGSFVVEAPIADVKADTFADFDVENLDEAVAGEIVDELDALEQSLLDSETTEEPLFSVNELRTIGEEALTAQLELPPGYEITNVLYSDGEQIFTVRNSIAETSWQVPFQIASDGTSHGVLMAAVEDWTVMDEEVAKAPVENSAAPRQKAPLSDLEVAQQLREIRLSDVPAITNEEDNLSFNSEELDRLDLSDEQRAAFQSILNDNAELSAKTRESDADVRISELEEMGLKEKPGFLKLYREVMLSDDGGAAVVLLSEGQENEKLTALEILDRALDALKDDEGSVSLSDQALVSGNDNPPPADPSEELALDDRVAGVKMALGL
jgi:hypothetical protein